MTQIGADEALETFGRMGGLGQETGHNVAGESGYDKRVG